MRLLAKQEIINILTENHDNAGAELFSRLSPERQYAFSYALSHVTSNAFMLDVRHAATAGDVEELCVMRRLAEFCRVSRYFVGATIEHIETGTVSQHPEYGINFNCQTPDDYGYLAISMNIAWQTRNVMGAEVSIGENPKLVRTLTSAILNGDVEVPTIAQALAQ